jgi:hypothetical protein
MRCLECGYGLIIAGIVAFGSFAHLAPDVDPDGSISAWSAEQRNMLNGSCCGALHDEHLLNDDEWRMTDNGYQVWVEGQWRDVDPDHMRRPDTPNPTRSAIVWWDLSYLEGKPVLRILCFAPGTEY